MASADSVGNLPQHLSTSATAASVRLLSGITGKGVATYTAALVSDTSNPYWAPRRGHWVCNMRALPLAGYAVGGVVGGRGAVLAEGKLMRDLLERANALASLSYGTSFPLDAGGAAMQRHGDTGEKD